MALVDVDSWHTEYEACERLNHEILRQMALREKRQRLSPEYNRLTAGVHLGLKQFETELRQLKDKLLAAPRQGGDSSSTGSTSTSSITAEEAQRRQRQLEGLQSQLQQLRTKFGERAGGDADGTASTSAGRSPWQSTANQPAAAPIIDTSDVNTLKQRQIDILEEQNRGLETLSQTISRQRALASQLGQEVEDHNEILGELADSMDRVESGVHRETTNIAQVNRRDSTWGYWLVIIVLFVAIIVVIFI